MPNMAVYRNEYDQVTGRYYQTDEYYLMPPAASGAGLLSNNSGLTSYHLRDMVDNGNPVAIANEAWRKWSTYTITPQFSLEYKLLGKSDDETHLDYTGEVYMNAYTETKNSYYPSSLSSTGWINEVNTTSNMEFKSLNFTTRHQLVYKPYFLNDQHSLQVLARFEVGSNSTTNQFIGSSGIGGGITDPTVPGYLRDGQASSGTGQGHWMNGTASFHYSYGHTACRW